MTIKSENIQKVLFSKMISDSRSLEYFTDKVNSEFFQNDKMRTVFEELVQDKDNNVQTVGLKMVKAGMTDSDIDEFNNMDLTNITNEYLLDFYTTTYSNRLVNLKVNEISKEGSHLNKLAMLDEIKEKIERIDASSSTITTPDEALDLYREQLVKNARQLRDNPNGIPGIPMGLERLDSITLGISQQDYIILAARPSMGKTSAVIKAVITSLYENKVTVVFSMETPVPDFLARIISAINSNLKLKETLFGHNFDDNIEDIDNIIAMLRTKKLYIEDFHKDSVKSAMKPTPALFKKKLKQIKQIEGEIGLVIADHIGLMSATNQYLKPGNETVTDISREIKLMIREFQAPFIVLSQLNRDLEKREDKRPRLSDLRDSGSLEQDADKIIFIYRSYIYRVAEIQEKIKIAENASNAESLSTIERLNRELELLIQMSFDAAEFHVKKNRNGPLGVAEMFFIRENATFQSEMPEEMNLDEIYGNSDIYERQ